MAASAYTQSERSGLFQPPDGQQSLFLEMRSAIYVSGKDADKARQWGLCKKLLRYNIHTRGQNEVVQRVDMYRTTYFFIYTHIYERYKLS